MAVGSLQHECTSLYGTQKAIGSRGKKGAVLDLAPPCLHKYFKDHNICISCLEDKPKDLIRAWEKVAEQQSTLQSTLCPQYPSVMLGSVRDSGISRFLFLCKWLSFQGGLLMTQILETKFEGLDFQYSDGIQLWSLQLNVSICRQGESRGKKKNLWTTYFSKERRNFIRRVFLLVFPVILQPALWFSVQESLPVLSVKEDKGTSHHGILNQLLALDSVLRSHYSQKI